MLLPIKRNVVLTILETSGTKCCLRKQKINFFKMELYYLTAEMLLFSMTICLGSYFLIAVAQSFKNHYLIDKNR